MKKELGWQFDNSYFTLPSVFYKKVPLNEVSAPRLVALNRPLAMELGLHTEALQTDETIHMLAGNKFPAEAAQIAQAYAGHQFGHFNMLGDGRTLLLGEHITPKKERVDIQLKGAGRTAFSRGGDGRASLGPMLRELIISEAMHALNIPTTRSLAVVTTGEAVYRETVLEGAILTRVAASHLRVGTFQYAAAFCELEDVKALADYAIERHYPDAFVQENRYIAFFGEVMERQAALLAKWQLIGFVHGVMNTDNMTISGETIDYGPCAFLDTFDPNRVFSSIDREGRYRYSNQPFIGGWNLARLAESMLPLFATDEEEALTIAKQLIGRYEDYYEAHWLAGMREKLGLLTQEQEDLVLAEHLLTIMAQYEADFTNTFRALSDNERPASALFNSAEFHVWEQQWQARLARQGTAVDEVQKVMQAVNPAVIPRNHLVEAALAAAQQADFSKLEELMQVCASPYNVAPEYAHYTEPPKGDEPYVTYCGT